MSYEPFMYNLHNEFVKIDYIMYHLHSYAPALTTYADALSDSFSNSHNNAISMIPARYAQSGMPSLAGNDVPIRQAGACS